MVPRIGITASKPDPPSRSLRFYGEAIARAGATFHYLANDVDGVAAVIERYDGIVLAGGIDVDPQLYGGRRLPSVDPANPARDAFEIALARAARERAVPLLGICRGLHVVNVAFGGTLVEDIPSAMPAALPHQQQRELGIYRTDYAPGHEVRIASDAALAALFGTTFLRTNSVHHQAVREVAPDFRAAARTSDGVIEALEPRFAHPFYTCVQWHPEALRDDAASARLFAALVAATRAKLRPRAAP